jgi:methionyl-tRNA formyltransferase
MERIEEIKVRPLPANLRIGLLLPPVPSAPTSIVFLGSNPIGYECLQYLLSRQHELGLKVAGILTQPRKEFGRDHDLAALAGDHGIPVIPSLNGLPDCDIIYSVQHHEILRQDCIDRAARIAVNLHMAPLPEYRGCNQFSFAIIDGKKEFGATIHRIDARIDHGDILFEKRFPVPEDCWVGDLYDLTYAASLALFRETLPDIIAGRYSLTLQQDLVKTRGTSIHYRKDILALKQIDLSWPLEKIGRYVRATSMPGFEPPYAMLAGRKIYFKSQPEQDA